MMMKEEASPAWQISKSHGAAAALVETRKAKGRTKQGTVTEAGKDTLLLLSGRKKGYFPWYDR